jgi:hypothetical protein
MEDCLHWVESQSPYLLRDGVLPSPLAEMWKDLSSAARHYLRFNHYSTDAEFEEACDEAAAALKRFATSWEAANLPIQHLTYNLHMVVCR